MSLHRSLATALLLGAATSSVSAQIEEIPYCPVVCSHVPVRGEAYQNTASTPLKKKAYDFIPVHSNTEGFFVVYSHRGDGPEGTVGSTNNVGIFVIPLLQHAVNGRDQVLIFGSGYGDWEQVATYGAACDASFVDYVIQQELGFQPLTTTLKFVAPHGHYDHINPQFPRRLANLGYKIGKIHYHQDDENLIFNPGAIPCNSILSCPTSTVPYQDSELPKISEMNWSGNGTTCEVDLQSKRSPHDTNFIDWTLSFDSPLGTIRFATVPGHTCGSIDLWLDAGTALIRVMGSNVECSQVPWWVNANDPIPYGFNITAHGNIVIPQLFP